MGKQFRWEKVDPRFTRELLSRLDEPRRSDIRTWSDDKLARSANVSLGQVPKEKFTDDLVRLAVTHWIPTAAALQLEELASWVQAGLSGTARTEALRTKPERIRFLQERKVTKLFKANVRKAFLAAHREHVVTEPGPRGRRTPATGVALVGEGRDEPHALHAHQGATHVALDAMPTTAGTASGLVVLPTGSGKTETMVSWLLRQMDAQPDLRVLWIAHQQELLNQTERRFVSWAPSQPVGFRRTMRTIHGEAQGTAQLANDDVDIALVTVQSLTRNFERTKKLYLRPFLSRPTIVVVDEAHHAASNTYHDLLDHLIECGVRSIVGLTATPFPTSTSARRRFAGRFQSKLHEVSSEQLIREKILARPVLHTVDTYVDLELTPQEIQASAADLAASVLGQLDTEHRNSVVVKAYLDSPDRWGKTLVFATSIAHAEHLRDCFTDAGIPPLVLHSRVSGGSSAIEQFRRGGVSPVLISVGMLTEGVDLPDARTAFLARPTTSHILLRQMIGRVLRGPRAGGEAEAHVVYFSDLWRNFAEILEPPDVVGDIVRPPRPQRERDPGTDDEPLQVTEVEDEIGSTGIAAVRHQFQAGAVAPMSSCRLAGYFQLDDRVLPVFSHQMEMLDELIDAAATGSLHGTPLLSFFEDVAPPTPTARMLRALVDDVRGTGERPPFVELSSVVGVGAAADRLQAAGPQTEHERSELIRRLYEETLAKVAYPTLRHFRQALEDELNDRRDARSQPEGPVPPPERPRLPKLPRVERDVEPARRLALDRAEHLLPADVLDRLVMPPIVWTRRATSSFLGMWHLRVSGPARGKQEIRLNALLSTSEDIVSDEMLAYLIYHEMLHHLLPGQGHDAEFRDLEFRCPTPARSMPHSTPSTNAGTPDRRAITDRPTQGVLDGQRRCHRWAK